MTQIGGSIAASALARRDPRAWMRDRQLSDTARGLLALLALDQGFVTVESLVDVATETAAEILSAIAELQVVGLVDAEA